MTVVINRSSRVYPVILSLALQAGLPIAWADTRYVTDQLEITLRSGESTAYRILRMLPSGTPLEVLAIDPKTKYARVRTQDGTLGYVLARQLQTEPVARTRLAETQARLDELQREPSTVAAQLARLRSEHASLTASAQRLQRERERLEQELATIRHASANVLAITEERDGLRARAKALATERDSLIEANGHLSDQNDQRWFMVGAGVLVGGILIGLILPRLRSSRRKSSW